MKQPRHVVAYAIAERTLGIRDSKKLAQEVAAYLIDQRRSGDLESILRDIMQYRADHGIVEVVAVSAFPLTAAVVADIEREVRLLYPAAQTIIVSHRLDSSVVAGVKLEFANQQLDMSVRGKLNKLKQLTQAGNTGRNDNGRD